MAEQPQRFSVKFFSPFLQTPRPIAALPGIGQVSLKQMMLSLGAGLLVGGIVNVVVGPVAFFGTFLVVSAVAVVVFSREQDHIQLGERLLAALLYQMRARLAPEELVFLPDAEALVSADGAAQRPVVMLDADERAVSVHRGGL